MFKFLYLIVLCFQIVQPSFGSARRLPRVEPGPAVTVTPITSGDQKVSFTVKAGYATSSEVLMIEKASRKAYETIHSDCFREFMRNRKMIQTGGRTSIEVADHLQSLSGTVPVVMYYRSMRFTSAVAYRQPPSLTINLNRAYFTASKSVCEWASTIAHESFGHSLGGYDHDFKWNHLRDFSVPYSIGGSSDQNKDAFQVCCK